MKRYRLLVVVGLLIIVAAIAAAVFALRTPSVPEQAEPVQKLLELRQERSVDTSAYAEVVASRDVAEALVSDVTTENAATSPIPDWETPYLSAKEATAADVAVVWKKSAQFKDWSKVTVFKVGRLKGRWVVIDADETSKAPEPVEP